MSFLPTAASAVNASSHKCSNYCVSETCVSVLTDSLSYSSSDLLNQQQAISEDFQNETVPLLPSLYSSKITKTSLVFPTVPFGDIAGNRDNGDAVLLNNDRAREEIELQKYAWKCVQNQEEPENYINESKSYVPESSNFLRETQDETCDKNYLPAELYEGADTRHPRREKKKVKTTEYFSDDYSTSEETVMKVQDDGIEVAWVDIKRVKTAEGFCCSCSLCCSFFKSESSAILHLQEHGITKPYKCLWCESSSQTEFEAKVHYRSHTGITLFCCDCCDRQFSKEETLQRHKAECGPSVGSLSPYLQSHISKSSLEYTSSSEDDDEENEETVTRTTCDGKESSLRNMSDGKGNSDSQDSNDCSSPVTNTSSDNNIIVNNVKLSDKNPSKETKTDKKNSNKALKNFQCSTCGKAFRASKPLKEHEVVHTGAREFPCEICGKAFGTRANRKIHLATHSDKRPFSCDVCNATFRQKDSLKVHLRKHNGERPFACPVCSMTFDRSFTFKNHLLTHGEEKSHVCAVCGKAFTTRGGLNNHEKLHAKDPTKKKARKPPSKPGTGSWICDECGKLYSTRSNLKMHKRSHEPVAVTHTCPVCGRVYKHKDSLEVHMRKHKDERPYNCATCGRNFYRNWTLKLHLLTHTGEKPHKCTVDGCDKSFSQSSSRYNHIQSHHKHPNRLKNNKNLLDVAQPKLNALECAPAALECAPAALECAPAALECAPAALECAPAALECAPAALECAPAALECAPAALECAPAALECAPAALECAPAALECAPEGVSLADNTMNSVNQSDSIVMDTIQSVDTLSNNHPSDIAALYLVNSQNRNAALSDQVNIIMPPSSLSLDTSTLPQNPLAGRVGVGDAQSSVLNGLVVDGHSVAMTPEVPLLQRQADDITQSTHLNLVTHHIGDSVGPLCPTNVSGGLVWDTSVLPIGLSNIPAGIHLPQTHQPDPGPLQSLSQSLDPSLYVLPEHVPLLVSVDGHLYQQDTHLRMASLQNNFVSQLN